MAGICEKNTYGGSKPMRKVACHIKGDRNGVNPSVLGQSLGRKIGV